MTGNSEKLRGLFLAFIMITSVVVAGVALSGSAAATSGDKVNISISDQSDIYPSKTHAETTGGVYDGSGNPSVTDETNPISISLSPDENNYSDENIRVEVQASREDGSSAGLEMWAQDSDGTWFNTTKTGWGPEDGFTLDAENTTDVYPAGSPGVYNVTLKVVNKSGGGEDLTSVSNTISIGLDSPTSHGEFSGETLDVAPGTYNESVTVNVTNVTLVSSEGPERTEITDPDEFKEVVEVTASNVTLDGFTVTSGGTVDSTYGTYGIRVIPRSGDINNVTVKNNILKNISDVYRAVGISVSTGETENQLQDITVENNTVYDIEATVTTDPEEGNSIAKGITQNGDVSSSEIINNNITDIGGEESAAAHGIALDGGGPTNFTVANNQINSLETNESVPEGDTYYNDPSAIIVGGFADLGADHAVYSNNFLDGQVYRYDAGKSTDTLNATSNWWGSPNGPSAGEFNTYNDGNQGAEISDNVEFTPWLDNSTDNGGEQFAPVTNGSDGQFASIGAAVNETSEGGTISAKSGTYIEEVEIDKPLTLESEGTTPETTIRLTQEEASSTGAPTVDILSPGVTVDGFTVQRNSTGPSLAQGIRVSNGSESGDTVVVSNNTVENLNTTRSVDNGILVGDNNDGDTPANVIVRSNTVSEFPNGIGVTSKTSGEVVRNVTVRNNTLYDNGVGFGVSNVSGAGVESIEATQNNITQNSVGVYLFGNEDAGILSFTDVNASEVSVTTNDIIDNDGEVVDAATGDTVSVASSIINNGANELDASLNYYGDGNTPDVSGTVIYDPVLTTSIENISADSTSEIRQYGSVVDIQSNGKALAVGFSAPSNESLSELFGDVQFDDPAQAYHYDIDDGFVNVTGDYTPSTGEVVVIATESDINDTITIPIAVSETDTKSPTTVALNGGWNLVPTGAAPAETVDGNQVPDVVMREGTILESKQDLQAQPAQSGAPPADYEAFDGTWVFVERDIANGEIELLTGHETGQSAEDYSQDVLDSDEESES